MSERPRQLTYLVEGADAGPTWISRPHVEVTVPATSANLGVGFDVMGLALNLEARFYVMPAEELSVSGCADEFAGPDNLVWRAYMRTCEMLDAPVRPVAIHIASPLPLSGGLGASSTCVVAGVVAALLLSGRTFDRSLALNIATAIEGHPDNVAPALFGGLTSSFVEAGVTYAAVMPVGENLRFVCMAPPYVVRTEEARRLLPQEVTRADAVWQMGRCVAMADALERGDAELISRACHDKLHEPHRMRLIADYDQLRTRALAAGACAFVISGSGSSMIAITDGDEIAKHVLAAVEGTVEDMWVKVLHAQTEGTRVIA